MSAAEAAFGVTEEERLAKEEEERNVALVEIQLRDENSFPALGVSSRSALPELPLIALKLSLESTQNRFPYCGGLLESL